MNINVDNSLLLVIDVQGKLASMMPEHEALFINIARVIQIAQRLDVPILWSEQAPDKIGQTVEPIASLLFPLLKPMIKRTFSCYQTPSMRSFLDQSDRQQIIVVGIEAHVCVFQTVRDLVEHGYDVLVVVEAVSSKTQFQKEIALSRMASCGAQLVTAESIATEWLYCADHPRFRDVMANIKR